MRSTYRFHENVNHLFEYGFDAAGILSPLANRRQSQILAAIYTRHESGRIGATALASPLT